MANNVTLTDYNGDPVVMATLDVSSVHYTKHLQLPSVSLQRAAISIASSGDNTLVAAPSGGEQIKVVGLLLVAAGAVTVTIQSGAAGTNLTGAMSLITGTPLHLPTVGQGYHYFEAAANTLLNASLGGAVQVSGYIIYYEE